MKRWFKGWIDYSCLGVMFMGIALISIAIAGGPIEQTSKVSAAFVSFTEPQRAELIQLQAQINRVDAQLFEGVRYNNQRIWAGHEVPGGGWDTVLVEIDIGTVEYSVVFGAHGLGSLPVLVTDTAKQTYGFYYSAQDADSLMWVAIKW